MCHLFLNWGKISKTVFRKIIFLFLPFFLCHRFMCKVDAVLGGENVLFLKYCRPCYVDVKKSTICASVLYILKSTSRRGLLVRFVILIPAQCPCTVVKPCAYAAYAGFSPKDRSRMLRRVRRAYDEESSPGISLKDYLNFYQVLCFGLF